MHYTAPGIDCPTSEMALRMADQPSGLLALPPKDRLIVALDVSSVDQAKELIEVLGDKVTFYKVGHHLQFRGGLELARDLAKSGKHVFLDVKLHDIPNTVEAGIRSIADWGMRCVTVHAYPQTMQAALKGCEGTDLSVLGVTVLTSMDDQDALDAGFALPPKDLVQKRAAHAHKMGVHGLVCSPQEVPTVRKLVGGDMALVTPGIRNKGSETGDQKRVAGPKDAIEMGSDFLVVGRPITEAEKPDQVADMMQASIKEALESRQ